MKCHNEGCNREAVIICGMMRLNDAQDCIRCFLENASYIIQKTSCEDVRRLALKKLLLEHPEIALEL